MNTSTHMALFNVKRLAEKCCIFSAFPLLLYINCNSTLPSLCEALHKDGWGEGFEQREIEVGNGTLYVHLWQSEHWDIQTEEEQFTPKLAEGLPEMCFSLLPGSGQLICIKRGENGYYPSDWSTDDARENRRIADEQNARLGISPAQEEAMKIGSLCGWDVPGTDPANCEDIVQRREGMTFDDCR